MNVIALIAFSALASLCPGLVGAQELPYGALVPANPTSADNIQLQGMKGFCGPYKTNAYNVNMVENNIIVRLGQNPNYIVGTCPPEWVDAIDLGRLPAGSYTITVIRWPGDPSTTLPPIVNAPFTVTNSRAKKIAGNVRLDYTGQWWNPADSGSGLYVWQDTRPRPNFTREDDPILAAWFTYDANGNAKWYVFQPQWTSSAATSTVELFETSRMPGPTIPPPNPTTSTVVGTASLDFRNVGSADEGKFAITFAGGLKQIINIQRFKP